jgi:hypothetical protein
MRKVETSEASRDREGEGFDKNKPFRLARRTLPGPSKPGS